MGFTDKIKEMLLPKFKENRILVLALATILSLYGTYSVFASIKEISQENISNLHSELAETGVAPEQLEINQANTYLSGKTPDNEILEGIFKQNEQEILKREQLIAGMQSQLKAIKQKELPTMQIAKEIAAQYPQLLSLILARGDMVDAMLIGTGNENTLSEQAVAIMKFSEPISEDDKERLQKWLAIRLDVPSIKIIVEQ